MVLIHSFIHLNLKMFLRMLTKKSTFSHPHPYHYEITNIIYPSHIFEDRESIKYLPIQLTPLTWVDNLDGFLEMCQKLENSREIAVDLEVNKN